MAREMVGSSFLSARRFPQENPSVNCMRIYGWINGLIKFGFVRLSDAPHESHGSRSGKALNVILRTLTLSENRSTHSVSVPLGSVPYPFGRVAPVHFQSG